MGFARVSVFMYITCFYKVECDLLYSSFYKKGMHIGIRNCSSKIMNFINFCQRVEFWATPFTLEGH